jgi:hypothetical protein
MIVAARLHRKDAEDRQAHPWNVGSATGRKYQVCRTNVASMSVNNAF